MKKLEEVIDVVDEEDNVLRQEARSIVRQNTLLFRSVQIIVLNPEGRIFVQKRSEKKDSWPGMYAIGVGETVKTGETYEAAAIRGVKEEIGQDSKPRFICTDKFRSDESNENFHLFECVVEDVVIDKEELSEGFFVSRTELHKMHAEGKFTPMSSHSIKKYLSERGLIVIVDDDDKIKGAALYREAVENSMIFQSANVLIVNSQGNLFVHKRSQTLETHPGKYDVKVGGIVDLGETYKEAAIRELKEEVGVENVELVFLFALKFRQGIHKNNRQVYKCKYDGKFELQKEEVAEGKFMMRDEIEKLKVEGKLSDSAVKVWEEFLKHGKKENVAK